MAGRRVNKKTKRKKKRIGTMDLILLLVFICLVIFTVTMIRLFQVYGSVPDTLVTCVFATLGGECGILGWIKTNKDKRQDRRWQREDMKRERRRWSRPCNRQRNRKGGIDRAERQEQ